MHLRPPRWRASSVALVVACTFALLLGARSILEAHTALVASEPAAGSTLASAPGRIRLVFSEQIEPGMATIGIVGASGTLRPLAVSGDPHDVHALIAPVSDLSSGMFRVVWHVVSADGHPVGGSYVFTVGAGGAAPPPETALSTPAATWGPTLVGAPLVPALLRGIAVGTMMAAAGLLLFIVWCGDDGDIRALSLARRLVLVAPIATIAHLAAWTLNASPDHRLTAGWLDATMGSTVGRVELWRTALSIAPLWALWLARRPALALALATIVLFVSAAIGHSAATDPLLAVSSKALHLTAGAAWLGGLLWLVLGDSRDAARADRDALRVSSVALVALLIVLGSGLVQTLILLPIRDFASAYGAIAGAKLLGLLVLAALGAFNRYRVLPRIAAGDDAVAGRVALRSTVVRELTVMTVVILLGGLLSYVSPPAGAGTASQTSSHSPDDHT